MKILHVVPTYFPAVRYGGPIFSVHGLCAAQVENGHHVSVYTTNVDGHDSLAVPVNQAVELDGVQVHYFQVKQTNLGWSRRLYHSTAMVKALQQTMQQFDIVHLHSIYLLPTWYAARQARKQQVPYILSPRGMLVKELIQQQHAWLKKAWILLMERHTIKHAAGLHYTSQREQLDAAQYVPDNSRDFILANGISPSMLMSQANAVQRQKNQVLYLGRINWKKGLERLIGAIARLPDARLIIAGNDEEGYTAQLENIIAINGLQSRVKLLGFVDSESKQQLLSSSTLLALCSDNENFGNVVLEAMATATPVVVTDGVGASAVVQHYQSGIVTDKTPDNIAKSIQALLNNTTLCRQFGENGRRAAHQHFVWARIAASMVNHYQSFL